VRRGGFKADKNEFRNIALKERRTSATAIWQPSAQPFG